MYVLHMLGGPGGLGQKTDAIGHLMNIQPALHELLNLCVSFRMALQHKIPPQTTMAVPLRAIQNPCNKATDSTYSPKKMKYNITELMNRIEGVPCLAWYCGLARRQALTCKHTHTKPQPIDLHRTPALPLEICQGLPLIFLLFGASVVLVWDSHPNSLAPSEGYGCR